MTLNLGIIGIGYGQHVLLPVFAADERVTVRALCASSPERAAAIAEKNGVPLAFGNWRAMLPEVDAVAVAVPPHLQPEIAIAAMQAGKPVFVEKPLAVTLEHALAMQSAADSSGVPNVVDFEFPEIPAWRAAHNILRSGELGELAHIEVNWAVETYANRHRLDDSWKTGANGGGTLSQFMSHVFYHLEWFTGQTITRLNALIGNAPDDPRGGDTLNGVHVQFADGLFGMVTVSTHAFLGSGHRMTFYGSEGTLVLENRTRDYVRGFTLMHGQRGDDTLRDVTPPDIDADVDGRRYAAGKLTRRFVDWALDGVPTTPTIANGVRVQRLLTAARNSHTAAGWVDV